MKIAINAVAAFKEERTGVEEYAYQLIKHFAQIDSANQFILYKSAKQKNDLDFALPDNFKVKSLGAPFLWSQVRLAVEMQDEKPDVLFVPAQVAPFFCVKDCVVTVHGLEYEYFPKQYPLWFRVYLRFFTKYALRNARRVIAVSENTKNDLVKLYGRGEQNGSTARYKIPLTPFAKGEIPSGGLWNQQERGKHGDAEKIEVVRHGVEGCHPEFISGSHGTHNKIPLTPFSKGGNPFGEILKQVQYDIGARQHDRKPYILYIGRIETKKNLVNLVKAFDIFKQKYQLPHQLVLIGGKGYGWEDVYEAISQSKYKDDIIQAGFLPDSKKMDFLKGAELFVFTSLYEGFGMPVLEAMVAGTPVLASNNSSLPEVCGDAAVLVSPQDVGEIAENMYNIISKEELRNSLIRKGFENVKRFSWEKCARETLKIIYESSDRP